MARRIASTFDSSDSMLPDAIATLLIFPHAQQDGRTFAAAFVAPIPRRLWMSKPVSANAAFTKMVYPALYKDQRVELGLTLAGEAIWNFGWPGLSIFLVLGVLLGVLYVNAKTRSHSAVAVCLYAIGLAAAILTARADLYNGVIQATTSFLPAIAILAIARDPRSRALESRPAISNRR
jgi:hypothetical protein